MKKKSELLEEIEHYENQLSVLKAQIKKTPKHINWDELPEDEKFHRLVPSRKRLMDTVRMIAYRAETAMADLLVDDTVDMSTARTLLQGLYNTEADILPDEENSRLRIRVHSASNPAANQSLQNLFAKLNETQTKYPGSDLTLYYQLSHGDF